ncbi:MAG TPA: hypothetical protein VHC22_10585 [Pirellulales bacterium]|nr:hypothetical protein [Pirellulales bacterium]
MTTLIISLLVVASTVLANTTFEMSYAPPYAQFGTVSYGWPFVWRWYWVAPWENFYGWDFSAACLAGNIAVWLGTVALAASMWEFLLRWCRPRWRFSLRRMLAAVALVSVLFAWGAAVWKRADEQDALAASGSTVSQLWVERPGPKWLRLVVPDRYRRCVVGARIEIEGTIGAYEEGRKQNAEEDQERLADDDERNGEADDEGFDPDDEHTPEEWQRQHEKTLTRLVRLGALRFLSIAYDALTPAMTDTLANLQQLRILHVCIPSSSYPGRPTSIAWVGRLRQLEQLSLERVGSDELGCLANLVHLRSLTLDLTGCEDDESEIDRRLAAVGKLTQLRRLRLQGSPGAQMSHLSGLTNLKSLSLEFHHFDRDEERLVQCFAAIGKLTQVEELRLAAAFDVYTNPSAALRIRADNLASLGGMKSLRSLWLLLVSCEECNASERQACLAAIAKLTQLRRLWLAGDLVTTGLAELAPLESLEELEISDEGMRTATAVESLCALKGLKAVDIPGLAIDLFASGDEAADARHAAARRVFQSFQRAHPGRVSNLWLEEQKDLIPWRTWQEFNERTPDLDSFLGGNPAMP